jgi:hypothetical protein
MSRPKKEKVTGGWRKLCDEELHNVYSSSNIITVIKSRRVRLVLYVAYMGEMRNACSIRTGDKMLCGAFVCRWES